MQSLHLAAVAAAAAAPDAEEDEAAPGPKYARSPLSSPRDDASPADSSFAVVHAHNAPPDDLRAHCTPPRRPSPVLRLGWVVVMMTAACEVAVWGMWRGSIDRDQGLEEDWAREGRRGGALLLPLLQGPWSV